MDWKNPLRLVLVPAQGALITIVVAGRRVNVGVGVRVWEYNEKRSGFRRCGLLGS